MVSKVANDYGHGVGQDRGANGYIPEEDVINNIASHTDVLFQKQGVEVVWTRPTSVTSVNDSLRQRVNKANSNGVDLLISHHANMAKGNGHEVWVLGLGGQAEQYARKVDRALTSLGSNSRGIKVGNLGVLKGNAPAILIEYFFLDTQSNVDFYNRIGAYAYAKAVVEAITGESISNPTVDVVEVSSSEDIEYGTVTASTLNVRSDSNTNSSILGTLSKGVEVKINNKYSEGDWLSIYYGDNGGFVHKDYVSIKGKIEVPKEEEKLGVYYVVTNYLPADDKGYTNMETFNQIMKGDRYYIRRNEKGIWIETKYLEYNRCLELKNQFGDLFWNIYMD